MTAFVIVRHPPDEPERFEVRRWFGVPGALVRGEVVGESKTLDGARGFVPTDKENLGRQPTDDPCVEETWV